MKKLTAMAIALFMIVPSGAIAQETAVDPKDAQIAERDTLIGAQENLLNAYRCLLSLDLELVEQGCPEGPPQFVPDGWSTYGFSRQHLNFGLAIHGYYLPPTSSGSTLSLDCARNRIGPDITFNGFEMSVIRGMIEVTYTVGGTTKTAQWNANLSNTQLIVLPSSPSQTEEFLDDLATADENGLLVTVADADGNPATAKFTPKWASWAVNVIRDQCQ